MTRWLKMQKISETRRDDGRMNAIVESVVRWMNGSNCEADWAWDIVRYITWSGRGEFSALWGSFIVSMELWHKIGLTGGYIERIILRRMVQTVPKNQSISGPREAIFVCCEDRFMSIGGWSSGERKQRLLIIDCVSEHKIYLWLSLFRFVWWTFVNYHLYAYHIVSLPHPLRSIIISCRHTKEKVIYTQL